MARHVFNTFFTDTSNPLVSHHLDSYADLLSTKLPEFLKASNPHKLILKDDRSIDVYIGGRDGSQLTYSPPTDELGNAVLPHTCRLENRTYSLEIRAAIDIVYTIGKKVETSSEYFQFNDTNTISSATTYNQSIKISTDSFESSFHSKKLIFLTLIPLLI